MNKHWALKLGDVCEIVSGATPKTGVKTYWDGDIPWATPADLSTLDGPYIEDTPRKITETGLASCSAQILPANSVLLSSRAPIGHVAINTVPMATNQGFKSLVPKAGMTDAKFLYHWLQYNKARIQALGNGATFKEVSKAIVSGVAIDLPPLDEQRRIAAILDKADALRQMRKRAIVLLDSLTQSVLSRTMDRASEMRPLEELTTEVYRYPTYYGIEYVDAGVPEIRGELILDDGSVDTSPAALRYIAETTSRRFPKTILEEGDLVMSVRGTIGKVGRIPAELAGANMTANLIRLAPDRHEVSDIYLWEVMRSSRTKAALAKVASSTTIATIKSDDLKSLLIPVPSMAEQATFTQCRKELGSSQLRAQTALACSEVLFTALQHRAFSCQL